MVVVIKTDWSDSLIVEVKKKNDNFTDFFLFSKIERLALNFVSKSGTYFMFLSRHTYFCVNTMIYQ